MTDNPNAPSSPVDMGPHQAAEQVQAGQAVLIDVREADEFARSHAPFAISIPLGNLKATLPLLAISPEKTMIFQCQSGPRSAQACQIARSLSADQAIGNLTGGLNAWLRDGLPVVTASSTAAPPLFRMVQVVAGSFILILTIAALAGFYPALWGLAFIGFMLTFAGLTGWCGMAIVLSKLFQPRQSG